ncbi:MAG: bifunctional oligoribonuclease/PAP phosphatase NrnA [Wujia sp.]
MKVTYGKDGENPLKLVELLSGNKVFLQTHNFPDPDAIASAYGLQKFLEYHGVKSIICYVGSIDRFNTRKMMDNFGIEIYSYKEIESDMGAQDYIVNVDCQKPNANTTDLPGIEVACVDHHPVFQETDEYQYVDIRITGACSSIVAYYYYMTDTPISSEVATALAYGIKMDTDDLIRGTSALDMEMMNYLFGNADWSKLNQMYNSTIEFQDLKAYGAAIENIDIFEFIGFTYIPFECPNSLVAIISDFILSLDVVDVAIVYSINSDGIKFSVRSERKDIDAGKLIHDALSDIGSGGGHAAMAGGFVAKEQLVKYGRVFDGKLKELFMESLRKQIV